MKVLELFCGIGGCAAALGEGAEVTAAVDVDRSALGVYARNFPHRTVAATIESLPAELLRGADLWWLSPPCQPYTRRGKGRDVDDPRAKSLLALLPRIAEVRPPYLALENVEGFRGSRMHARLRPTLEQAGYEVTERSLCPSELGVPNRRPRFYLVAGRNGLREPAPLRSPEPRQPEAGRPAERRLSELLDPEPSPALRVDPELARRYEGALDVVDPDDPEAVTACFTSAYGRSPVRSGSYLAAGTGLRRFSPREILRLLGFPERFSLPPRLSLRRGWHLAGNSLSVPEAREVLAAVPGLVR